MRLREVLKLAGALSSAIVMTGCVLSVNPVVSESDAEFDPRLLGSWEEASSSDRAVISSGADNRYAIEFTSNKQPGKFEARLGMLGERHVLDVWPAPSEDNQEGPDAGLLVAGHLLLAVDIGQDEISVSAFEPDPLLASIRAGNVPAPHRLNENQLILTGTTDELRSALGPYLSHPGALSKPAVWRRAKPQVRAVSPPCFEASAWREADQLFRRDQHWLGADGASSVDLGDNRTLWLFSDTWIDPSGSGTRRNAFMVSNSLAIQTGTDPSTATMSFYWGAAVDGRPTAFFPDRDGESLWLGEGVRAGDRVVLFFSRTIRGTGVGLGFQSIGWTAIMVENPEATPSSWRVRELETSANPLGIIVGFTAAFQLGEHVYALGSQNPVKTHPVFAARWPVEQVRRSNLLEPEWWAGERLGWVPNSSNAPRWPLYEYRQLGGTVHKDQATQQFLAVHTNGFGPADVTMSAAPTLTGPWSTPRLVYRPPEYYRPNVMIYGASTHPQLTGGDLVLTYNTNTAKNSEHFTDNLIYYPRFVRLTRCENSVSQRRSTTP